ncbi:MAG: serine--tRNA ligase [Pirellulaceae bacterium]|nr:serine--tRNA ligase [Pirellulaceae bacterium]
MLERKYILANVEEVLENCRNRGVECDVNRLVDLEHQRKEKDHQSQEFNRLANEISKRIGKASSEERDSLKEEARVYRQKKETAASECEELDSAIVELQIRIPNLSHPSAPVGKDDKDNLEIRRGQHSPRTFDFAIQDHVEIGERLDLIDFEGGAKTTGAGFYFLKNEAVLLEMALQHYAISELTRRGFVPVTTPDLAQDKILEGIGFNPRGNETQVYSIENTNLCLVGTAEITLGGLYSGHTFAADELPLKLCGLSHCFRTEAGAAGRASKGLYRVHQFTKIEMFAYALPDQSEAILEELCGIECDLFDALGIPFRVVDTSTGDLGGPAYRKFDLEAWMPGRGQSGEWGEVTSTSNCTDYQARRLNCRYKTKGEKGTKFVHTLNGTAIACSRALIAILENNQQADGSITIPEVLQPMMGKDRIG